ncbi:MAG TPA: hypothetical protein VLO11_10020 [Luteolibacter sp.]|nr:hypothetical protein [Luteolibacter sp.]
MMRSAFLTSFLLATAAAEVVTVIDPAGDLPADKTVVWSPLFQATWDEMNRKLGGKPMKIEPPNELMAKLDAFEWDAETTLPTGRWKTWAGESTPEFLATVHREAAQMTGEAQGPFTLGNPLPGGLACFGLLDREIEFMEPFFKSAKQPLLFGETKQAVQFFGARGGITARYRQTTRVLAYHPNDASHALEVSCKDIDDKVILYLPPQPQDFQTACKWLREWRKNWRDDPASRDQLNDTRLHAEDDIRIPYVTLDVKNDFVGKLQGRRYYGKPSVPWSIGRAEQKTRFILMEKGAKVRVEVSLDPFGGTPPKPVPRRFIYDRPFFVFLWREQAEWPYLGLWIGNAAALEPMN